MYINIDSLQEILQLLEVEDEVFFDKIWQIGTIKQFSYVSKVVVSENLRPLLLLSLMKFRQIYALCIENSELKLVKPQLDEVINEIKLAVNADYPQHILFEQLVQLGYTRTYQVTQAGEFTGRGERVQIWQLGKSNPLVVDYFGNTIDDLHYISHNTYKTTVCVADVVISQLPSIPITKSTWHVEISSLTNALVMLFDTELLVQDYDEQFLELITQLQRYNIPTISVQAFGNTADELLVSNPQLLHRFTEQYQGSNQFDEISQICHPLGRKRKEAGILHGSVNRAVRKNSKLNKQPLNISELQVGDYVVHDLHGIGKYVGRQMRETIFDPVNPEQPQTEEYLIIEYASSSRSKQSEPDYLFVATAAPDNLSPYIGHDTPKLSHFGGVDFAKVKARTKKYARDVAKRLVKIYAQRMLTTGIAYMADDAQMRELEDSFEHELTPDQATAIEIVKSDMEAQHPMDRLICADVGFGKTEVALRAAFKAILSGKQVALLAPTTILSSQHFETFRKRYDKFPVRIELLNRFVVAKERRTIIEATKAGKVDLLIGTHALLTPKVTFRNIGLLIIDEEQRFGTMHKDFIKSLNLPTDILSMSATPIPRTLEMALTGIRDITTITTPPVNRRKIITNVLPNSDKLLQDALKNEMRRNGQAFVVHNNVQTLQSRANKIQELLPQASVAIAHGQMREAHIDTIINRFWKHEIDILVCTTIIETGIDIANANTLIVDNSEKFGLSQLHQLRGRVGRSDVQAYAYFLYSQNTNLSTNSYRRLETIQDLSDLGSGTAIALKDLELRGAGNFLGAEQSGYIAGVGYEMYISIMAREVDKVRDTVF